MFRVRSTIFKTVGFAVQNVKNLSGKTNKLVDLTVDKDGIAVMTLQRPPVNSLNLDMLVEMDSALEKVASEECKGMIITSAIPTIFSAGLDILELYKPDLKRAETFLKVIQKVCLKLFGSGYVTAAAINGHAPGAALLLALTCEYRVMMRGKFKTGLNETALGVVAQPFTMDTMFRTVAMRQAELALTTAKMFNVDEALQVGIIDDIAKDNQDAIDKCKEFITQFDHISPEIRAMTKLKIREEPMKKLRENSQKEVDILLNLLQSRAVQSNLEGYIKQLKLQSERNVTNK